MSSIKETHIKHLVKECAAMGIECAFRLDGVIYGDLPVLVKKEITRVKEHHWDDIHELVKAMQPGQEKVFSLSQERIDKGLAVKSLQSAVSSTANRIFGVGMHRTQQNRHNNTVTLLLLVKRDYQLEEASLPLQQSLTSH